jgi:hypothetical protein
MILDEDCTMSQAVSRQPVTAETQVRSQAVRVASVVDKVALRQVSFRMLQCHSAFRPPSIFNVCLSLAEFNLNKDSVAM